MFQTWHVPNMFQTLTLKEKRGFANGINLYAAMSADISAQDMSAQYFHFFRTCFQSYHGNIVSICAFVMGFSASE